MSQKYVEMGKVLGELTQLKNVAYGDSFKRSADVFRIWYPNGIQPDQYRDMLCQVRILDKQFRIATRKGSFGESEYRDIAGYGILGAVADEEEDGESSLEQQIQDLRAELEGLRYENAVLRSCRDRQEGQ